MNCFKPLLALCLLFSTLADAKIPDFASYTNVAEKKKAFFDFMYPLVVQENLNIMADRAALQAGASKKAIKKICEKYSDECDHIDTKKIQSLLRRVDVVPPSLVLAQAANESAWGTSRFARKGNNFFGQWCFSRGCGMVPGKRKTGQKHEVRLFDSPQDSIAAYMLNLNSWKAYRDFRKQREKSRKQRNNFSGYELSGYITSYSQRGEAYVKEIQSMISHNRLVEDYDIPFWQSLSQ